MNACDHMKAVFQRLAEADQEQFEGALTEVTTLFYGYNSVSRSGDDFKLLDDCFRGVLTPVEVNMIDAPRMFLGDDLEAHKCLCTAAALYAIATQRNPISVSNAYPRYWRNLNRDAQGWCKAVMAFDITCPSLTIRGKHDLLTAKGYVSCITENFSPRLLPVNGWEPTELTE